MVVLLTNLINKSITLHTFADIWKNVIVVPAQKSKQSSSLTNFQPIFILPVFSKVLEKVAFNQGVNHFTTHDLFSNKQSCFRSGYSIQDLLLYVTGAWLKAIDSGQLVGTIFWTQLIKAFDCINYDILL